MAAALLLVAGGSPGGVPAVRAATPCTDAQVKPSLRDVTVDQGVGSYGKLIRGKQAIVRFYLSLPSACSLVVGQSVTPTGAVLHVTSPSPGGPVFAFGTPYRPLTGNLASVVAADSRADPLFQVPGSTFQPVGTTGEFTIKLEATVTYTRVSSGVTTPGLTRTFSTFKNQDITRVVEQKTNALRILVVPMGDAALPYDTQFRAAERQIVIRGMTTLSRVLPVPDGVADLTTPTGGIRYTISAGLLDVGPQGLGLLDAKGFWCGSSTAFNAVKGPLGAILQDWNNANPSATADRVLGVVGAGISHGSGNGSPCDEGRAAVPKADEPAVAAYVRAIPDTSTVPSMTGALMTMELSHTFGVVSPAEANSVPPRTLLGTYHSLNIQADVTDPDRGFNLTTRSYLADDRSAMKLTTGWNDTNVLLEKNDWEFLACALGGETTDFCLRSNVAGTAEGIAAGPMFVLTGTTDGTPAACSRRHGTCVTESYYNGIGDGASGAAETPQDPGSVYRLLFLDASGGVLNDDGVAPSGDGFGVPVSVAETEHGSDPGTGTGDATAFLFSIAFPFADADATQKIQLVRDGASRVVLYERARTAAPVITRLSTPLSQSRIVFAWDDPADNGGQDTGSDIYSMNPDGSNVRRLTSSAANDTQPRVSPDGRMVTFTREPAGGGDSEIYLIWENPAAAEAYGTGEFPDETDLTNDPEHDDANPDWSPDGERLVYDSLVAPGDHDLRWLTYTGYFGGTNRWFAGTGTSDFEIGSDLLVLDINPTQTSIPVTGGILPSEGPYIASIENEHVRVVGNFSDSVITVERGVDGTTAEAHFRQTNVGFTHVQPLTQVAHDDSQPVWSSDGTSLAFTRRPVGGGPAVVALRGIKTVLAYDNSSRGRTETLSAFPPNIAADGRANPAGRQDAYDPDWVRGNDKLVFTTNWNGNEDIYTYDFSLEASAQLTDDPAADRYPSVDETTGRIVFRSDRDGSVERILRMDEDGGNVTELPADPAAQAGTDPAWYPRDPQSRILYARYVEPGASGLTDIWTMNPDGSDAHPITTGGIAQWDARWSPDATRIAFSGHLDNWGRTYLYTMDANGFDTVGVTKPMVHDGRLPCVGGICESSEPSWSPDGRKLAFKFDGGGTGWQIWIADADGTGQPFQVTSESLQVQGFSWSPDGTRIAYALSDGTVAEIYTIRPDGTGRAQLTTSGGYKGGPAWSPDSTTLAITDWPTTEAGSSIELIDATTGALVRSLVQALPFTPSPSYSGPSWSPDGRHVSFSVNSPIDFDNDCPARFNCSNSSVITIDVDGRDFVHRAVDPRVSAPDWSPGEDSVYLSAQIDGDPADARADLYYSCSDRGPFVPIAVAVAPESVDGAIASFKAHFDATFGCGDGEPTLTARVNDGYSISDPASPQPVLSVPKAPFAAIGSLRGGLRIGAFDPVPLVADSRDPETGALADDAFSWTVAGLGVVGTGRSLDVPAPDGPAGWGLGPHTVTLTVTDGNGQSAATTGTFTAQAAFAWVTPTKGHPAIETYGTAGQVVRVRFRLGADFGLGVLADRFPRSQRYICGDPSRLIQGSSYLTRPFGALGLTFDPRTQVYTYAWTTRAEWGNGALRCRQLRLRLVDDTVHRADFVLAPP
jgi:Tol biopolymer transport system component